MKKAIGILLVLMLALTTVVPISAAVNHKPLGSHANAIDVQEEYKSLIEIPSPDGTSYRCIMFCENHKQTADGGDIIGGERNVFLNSNVWLVKYFGR